MSCNVQSHESRAKGELLAASGFLEGGSHVSFGLCPPLAVGCLQPLILVRAIQGDSKSSMHAANWSDKATEDVNLAVDEKKHNLLTHQQRPIGGNNVVQKGQIPGARRGLQGKH